MALEMALCVMMVLEFAGKCSELGFPGGSVLQFNHSPIEKHLDCLQFGVTMDP